MNVFFRSGAQLSLLALALALQNPISAAESTATAKHGQVNLTLKQAFEAAWARQPEARAAGLRREAVEARREVATHWLAEPPSLELAYKTDQLNRNQGSREYEAGLSMPLWLPGERSGQRNLAEAEAVVLDRRLAAARLHTAGAVREAWWSRAQAGIDLESAEERRDNAERLAADVTRRVIAGDLSRADGHQANAAVAEASAAVARARGTWAEAAKRLRGLTGEPLNARGEPLNARMPESAEPPLRAANDMSAHPLLQELAARAESARAGHALANTQSRSNPELRLATTRDRANIGDVWSQTLTLGVRIPFGSDSRQRARIATASADTLEAEALLAVEREHLVAEIDAAQQRFDAARAWLTAAEQRARLTSESRGFFEKSFRLGETDLPTRLRVEAAAQDADREAARARVEWAASVSALRQALGLLPE